eukprot:Gregarina_sp_Poly_1__6067@NODE_31_length_19375_cov_31_776984_g28_i0_p15_GENE_NODE_31_length_19375_cov_31_776984_g28_i0NODE_31_length_19375_cov_31_776984_g28_i0_p15_ORF_typecomplete_len100_score6_15_NODE_31_length_19375_cov_31_776984_g28_i094469745
MRLLTALTRLLTAVMGSFGAVKGSFVTLRRLRLIGWNKRGRCKIFNKIFLGQKLRNVSVRLLGRLWRFRAGLLRIYLSKISNTLQLTQQDFGACGSDAC